MTLNIAGVPEVEEGASALKIAKGEAMPDETTLWQEGEFPCAEARKELSDGRGDEGEE